MSSFKNNLKIWIIIIISYLLLTGIFIGVIRHFINKTNNLKHNIEIISHSNDSLQSYILETGDIYTYNESLILSNKELNKILKDTQDNYNISIKEKKEIEKKLKSATAYISSIETNIHIDTIIIIDTSYNDTLKGLTKNFNIRNEWFSLQGKLNILFEDVSNQVTLNIHNIDINVPLTIGVTDKYQLYAKSSNPYIHFTSIDSAVLDGSKLKPKRKFWNRFSIGVQGGIGVVYGMTYNYPTLGTYVGVGVGFDIL